MIEFIVCSVLLSSVIGADHPVCILPHGIGPGIGATPEPALRYLLSTAKQLLVPRLTEDGRRRTAAFVFRPPSSVQKSRTLLRFDAL